MDYAFDRFLRYDELVQWLESKVAAHSGLISIETYGQSHEGRDLLLATITDTSTGPAEHKPAHWVDASIHAVELTATVAACFLIEHLLDGFGNDEAITRALKTRTFYVVPRVNPDGAELVLDDRPRFRRSSTRPWPWSDGHRWPGLQNEDIDGDGRILQMRIPDPNGGWTPHPEDIRLLVPIPPEGTAADTQRYRLLEEGSIADYDGFTLPTPRAVEGLDLNRNFPAGWGSRVPGAGDHPLSEPEIDALTRAVIARPNICGYNAFHTSGGVLLRPSSTQPDAKLSPYDIWSYGELAKRGTELTGYPAHSVYEDFTWDKDEVMSGAADDWAFEQLGVFAWTTEFWDVVHAATGQKQSTDFWYTGPSVSEALAVLRWCDANHPEGYVDWYPFDHPALGPIELGGWNDLTTWTNPPPHLLTAEVAPHADFAIHQALCAPEIAIPHVAVVALGPDTWRVEIGVANIGWLPSDVTARARKENLVLPATVDLVGAEVIDGSSRRPIGQLDGRAALLFSRWNDGTPDRALVPFVVRAPAGTTVIVSVAHPRAGRARAEVVLD